MAINGMGRPAKPDVKYFQRQLQSAERALLLTAGAGDISAGFMNVLEIYRHLHEQGMQPTTPLAWVKLHLPIK